jgi:hypothetical protein
MKPSNIFSVMDTALEARKLGEILNPLFTGEAGLGKSQVVQQWVKKQKEKNPEFGFIDLRIAYMEAPDLIGFPETEVDSNGVARTKHRLPEFWPTSGSGLLLLEEPNRGTTGVMNCLMQLLTDRKVHNYELPKGWVIAGCVNPDSSEYDVNTMDAALKNRFVEFEVEYDHMTFIDYVESSSWDEKLATFLRSGIWIYKTTKEIAKEAKYVSPRTWSQVNAAEMAGAHKSRNMHRLIVQSILGRDIGNEYHKFCYDQAPVTAQDLVKDVDAALNRLKQQSDPNTYQGDMIAATVESIEKAYGGLKKNCKDGQIDEDLMVAVAKVIPSDHAVNLIKACGFKQANGQINNFFQDFTKRHPELINILKSSLKVGRAVDKK